MIRTLQYCSECRATTEHAMVQLRRLPIGLVPFWPVIWFLDKIFSRPVCGSCMVPVLRETRELPSTMGYDPIETAKGRTQASAIENRGKICVLENC